MAKKPKIIDPAGDLIGEKDAEDIFGPLRHCTYCDQVHRPWWHMNGCKLTLEHRKALDEAMGRWIWGEEV